MPISASAIAREHLSCPSCCAPEERIGDACPSCGYTAAAAVQKFNFDAPPLEDLMDIENLFGPEGTAMVQTKLGSFRRKFPQFRIVICSLRLAPETNPREFGHWLLNASPFQPGEAEIDRRRTLLLILETESRQAAVTMGYDIEPFIEETPARVALEQGTPSMANGDFTQGAIRFLDELDAILTKTFRVVQKKIRRRS